MKLICIYVGGDNISEYFDVHSHVLPGLDDGAKNIEESKNMIHMAYNEGISHIIATPHFREGMFTSSKEDIESSYNKVKELIAQEGLDINIYLGNEVFFSHSVCDKLINNEIYTLADSNYVLVEFSPNAQYHYIKSALQTLMMSGYYPILAHFERYINVISNWDHVNEIFDMGVYFQVNASTLSASVTRKPTRFARKLLKYGMVDFIATDGHNDHHGSPSRIPTIKKSVSYISKNYGQDLVDKILYSNPSKIISNELI